MPKLLKLTFTLALLFIASLKTQAQGFNASIIAGLNASQITGDSLGGFNKAGLVAGAAIKRSFRKSKSSVQLEFLYARKGSRSKVDTSSSGPAKPIFNLTLTYIELPLLYNYQISKRTKLQLGAYYAVLNNAIFDDGNTERDITNSFFTNDFGYCFGGDVQIIDKLSFNARVTNSAANYRRFSPNYYNVVVSFSLRYTVR